jgi:hypothetical protein
VRFHPQYKEDARYEDVAQGWFSHWSTSEDEALNSPN